MKGKVETKKQVLPTSLAYIVAELEKEKHLKPSQVSRIIRDAAVKPADMEPWATFDHPIQDSYGRKLVHKGDNFEVMVMSWKPGDFSTIHDHGFAQWGAVQIFGPAEHATFRYEDGVLSTLARWDIVSGEILGVGHSLIHQMGNPTTDTFFLSLHVYGDVKTTENVTGDARLFDLEKGVIQRVNGGVFFALPPERIEREEGEIVADFPSRLRHQVELIRRLRKMESQGKNQSGKILDAVIEDLFSNKHLKKLLQCLSINVDTNGHQNNSRYWRILNHELREASQLWSELKGQSQSRDSFHKYAEMYDSLICEPCFDSFIGQYLRLFSEKYAQDLANKSVISLGAGTGYVETYMMNDLGVKYDNLYGIDISEAMVNVSRKHIQADVGDVLQLDPSIRLWDVAFSGLNVFHYLDFSRLEEAIQKTAGIIRSGGWFVGDFITPDHIRWYPNVMYSKDKRIISLRTPQLIEEDGRVFQESEIINIDFSGESMQINYAGKHKRFLPPMHRVRSYFEQAFGGKVDLLDAYSLELIPDWADSCTSTRYLVIAQKK
ncbi:MAG TPA: methyltransferase domain-containing protein [Bacteroidetes bacterium]|nr:methyltransferase domain-containing protein [Bacteroidota bacterium]